MAITSRTERQLSIAATLLLTAAIFIIPLKTPNQHAPIADLKPAAVHLAYAETALTIRK